MEGLGVADAFGLEILIQPNEPIFIFFCFIIDELFHENL